MNRLREIVGAEQSTTAVAHALHLALLELHAPVVGAMLVTCADEVEAECAAAFQQGFVRYCLPPLKFGEHAALRIANLGGQYEWGAVRIAEEHYAAAVAGADQTKVFVAKINAHAACRQGADGPHFGALHRYRQDTPCCSTLHALLEGRHLPFVDHLAEAFASEGKDRLAVLLDPAAVDPKHRFLYTAMTSARLMARKAVLDIQDYRPASRTTWIVLACVTINRSDRDTEIVCGYYSAPDAAAPEQLAYFGLSDDPAVYALHVKNRQLLVTDGTQPQQRAARDHRQLVLAHAPALADTAAVRTDQRIQHARRAFAEHRHRHPEHSRLLLRALLVALGDVAPVPAAMLLFAHGMAGVHHTWRMHRLAQQIEKSGDAREVLDEIHARVDRMTPAQREAMIELLMRECR